MNAFEGAFHGLTAAQDRAIASAIDGGADVGGVAAEYGVSKRTVYRAATRGRRRQLRRLIVAGYGSEWIADFAVSPDEPPVQTSSWRPLP